jgi:hypothetical protein
MTKKKNNKNFIILILTFSIVSIFILAYIFMLPALERFNALSGDNETSVGRFTGEFEEINRLRGLDSICPLVRYNFEGREYQSIMQPEFACEVDNVRAGEEIEIIIDPNDPEKIYALEKKDEILEHSNFMILVIGFMLLATLVGDVFLVLRVVMRK